MCPFKSVGKNALTKVKKGKSLLSLQVQTHTLKVTLTWTSCYLDFRFDLTGGNQCKHKDTMQTTHKMDWLVLFKCPNSKVSTLLLLVQFDFGNILLIYIFLGL